MSSTVATLLYTTLILGLFWLNRDHTARKLSWVEAKLVWLLPVNSPDRFAWLQSTREGRPSPALWLPVFWLLLSGSRSVSEWLHGVPPGASSEALLEGDPVNRVAYASLIAMALVVLVSRGRKVAALLQANKFVVVFLLYCALSLTWAQYPDVGFKRWVKAAGDLAMVLVVVSERDPAVAIRRLLIRCGFLLVPLSVLMIKYYPDLARYYDTWDWDTYYSGVTTNKNALGVVCLLFGLCSVWQMLGAFSGRERIRRVQRIIAHSIMLALVVWLFKYANSMTALACSLLGIAVLVAVEIKPIARMRIMVHVLVAILIAVPATVLLVGVETLLEMIGKDPTLTDRKLIWELLFSLTTNAWFGTGFENFWLGPRLERIWSEYSWAPNQAHNGYLEIYLNLGLTGIALLFLVLLAGYRTVMDGLRDSPLGGLMLAYFAVGIVYNLTEAAMFRISAPVWFVFLLTIIRVPGLHMTRTRLSTGRYPVKRAHRNRYREAREPVVAMTRNT